jgi:N-acetylglutamate synthase-like GNAT family acetyltransferase
MSMQVSVVNSPAGHGRSERGCGSGAGATPTPRQRRPWCSGCCTSTGSRSSRAAWTPTFFVAVDGAERVVGTAGLLRTGPTSGEVRKMFLLPEARGQGVGRALLDTVLDAARTRGLERLTLTTRHRYDRAIRLYERAGFRPAGSAREPRAGDPGIAYALRLAPERDRVPSRPAVRRRSLVPVPSFA